ncbi:uncharacterized protein LOC111022535 [Momordica charantia]|uniref:Uncharacterized protein LOC111022535 n=1 Tax=Momordica charantia TaxID=3673 RepID=A0A6J1DQ81_MOMCH|nr:uncharacterized protein LOC111022535 [Momordica charantia]
MLKLETLVKEMKSETKTEFDIVKNRHEHPLMFYRYGKFDGDVCCSRCHKPWSPPAFSCSDCNFHLHQSCIEFPLEIHTPFHPHHDGPLFITESNNSCNCCSQKPFGKLYECRYCSFIIDLQCAIVDTKASGLQQIPGGTGQYRHFAHPHPLTFQQQQQRIHKKVVCLVCQLLITSGSTSTYFCARSDSYFHKQCAELHREILNLDFHEHSLFLFPRPIKKSFCYSCTNECTKFLYSCPSCDFNLHVACLSSFKHQHDFTNFRKLFPYDCQLCGRPGGDEFPWYCSICQLFAHKKCATLKMSEYDDDHHHPSTHSSSHDSDIGALVEKENGVLAHFSHEHDLTLCSSEDMDRICDGCMQYISNQSQSYGCSKCGFHLHQECARLPRRHKNSSLHEHELSMIYIPNVVFSCAVCVQYCHGFAYHCAKCHYAIDIRCAAITIPFTHSSHLHPLFPHNGKKGHKCQGCGEGLQYKQAFGCDGCKFYLDARCAHLPTIVRNRFDEHPLILTFVNVPLAVGKLYYERYLKPWYEDVDEDEESDEYFPDDSSCEDDEENYRYLFDGVSEESDKYFCDICEEERMADGAFYWCRLCSFAAHPRCVIGDYPFLKSAKFEDHQHPLRLVKEGKKGYSACGACAKSCDGKLAFECGRCKFSVHAFGPCYHHQLTQSRMTFVMPSLRDRSIHVCLAPHERKGTKLTSVHNFEAELGSLSRKIKNEFLRDLPGLERAYFKYKQHK